VFLGIDIGSTFIKAVISDGKEIFLEKKSTGWNPKETSESIVNCLLQKIGLPMEEILSSVSTGYGRNLYNSSKQITEITCHAKGCIYLFKDIDFIIDVGGQDSKVIKVDKTGKVLEFLMNDKCAAGTGKFLQVMANKLEMDIEHFSRSADFDNPATISSMCTVFAETEIVSLIAKGVCRESIIAGIFNSIAKRIAASAIKLKGENGALVGGGANCRDLKTALERELGMSLQTSENSQYAGALGAMLIAKTK
jgi:predicted CoA-substrate-specific enzyme activase